jgi:hypothetical protein
MVGQCAAAATATVLDRACRQQAGGEQARTIAHFRRSAAARRIRFTLSESKFTRAARAAASAGAMAPWPAAVLKRRPYEYQ